MTIYNTGVVEFNCPLTVAAVDALIEHGIDDEWLEVDAADWSIEDEIGQYFEDDIQNVIDVLAPLGYVLNGEVQYYGDYEGKIYVEHNKITTRSIEDTGLYEADDATLIRMLKARGYRVVSPETLEHIVAGANVAGYLEFGEEIGIDSDLQLSQFILKKYHEWLPMETDDSFITFIEDELRKEFGIKEDIVDESSS